MIDLLPDADQQALLDSVTDFLGNEMPVERLRPRAGQTRVPPQPDRWHQFAEMGWFGIGLPEEAGGLGLGLAEKMLLARELGRHLVTPAVAAAMLAARMVCDTDANRCTAILGGECRIGIALRVLPATDEHYLIDAMAADWILCIEPGQLSLYAADSFTDRTPVSALDGTLLLERATLDGDVLHAASGQAVCLSARMLLLAQLVGCSEAALKLAVDYARVREQFGQPIARFQALKHLCADLATRNEAAWCQAVLAALSLQEQLDSAAFEAAAAELLARATAIEATEQCIQIHGGIGFTAECDAHQYLKRVHLLVKLLGPVHDAQARLLSEDIPA